MSGTGAPTDISLQFADGAIELALMLSTKIPPGTPALQVVCACTTLITFSISQGVLTLRDAQALLTKTASATGANLPGGKKP